MTDFSSQQEDTDSIFLAGELAPAGLYQRLGTSHTLRLAEQDYLPATFDGRVACYVRIHPQWSEITDAGRLDRLEPMSLAA